MPTCKNCKRILMFDSENTGYCGRCSWRVSPTTEEES